MSGTNRVLFDAPGPKARARIRIFTVLSVLVLLGVIALGVLQFGSHGQLAGYKWSYFAEWPYQRFLFQGLVMTLKAAAVAAVLALPFGAFLALGRLSENRLIRSVSSGYVELFRSVPLLLVLYVFLLAIPRTGYTFPVFWSLVIPIVLCSSAVLAEVFRAGVMALDRGQSEAAYALGMRRRQVMWLVVLPQAIRLVVPSLVSQMVSLLKDTTLGYVVSYPELLNQGKSLGSFTHYFVQSYLVVTAIYVVMNAVLSQLAHALERRAQRKPRADGVAPDPGSTRPPVEFGAEPVHLG